MRGRYVWVVALLVAAIFVLAPLTVFAQHGNDATHDHGDFLMKVGGSLTIGTGERVETLVVIDGDATISGTVSETLIVIDGDAVVLDGGVVRGDLYVVDGTLNLASGSLVENVSLWESDVTRAPDAIVTGSYDTEAAFDIGWSFGVVSFLAWVGMTLFVLAAGLLFAAVARKQLLDAGQLMTRDAGGLVIATILMVVGLPTLAVAAIVTLVGIPIGIGLLLIVLPILLFLGYLTAGIELGSLLIRRVVPVTESSHTYLSALAGLLTLQLVALVPFAGFWVLLFIATVGAGLLMLYIWRGWRGTRSTATPAASPGQAIPA